MDKIFFAGVRKVLAVAALTSGFAAGATPVIDTYYGGNDHGLGDIVGAPSIFDVHSFDMQRRGSMVHLIINTNFAGKSGMFQSLTDTIASGGDGIRGNSIHGKGIAYGDLLLANDWTPVGSAPYLKDQARNGTHWTYGFALDNRWSNTGGVGTLYRLASAPTKLNHNPDVLLSNAFVAGGTFRGGQAVAVNRASTHVEYLRDGTWGIDALNKQIVFDFSIRGTALEHDPEIALHWDMTCGNDVIEGVQPVPAPAAAGLLLLAGLGARKLRRRAAVKATSVK